ncbi:hypothetical protein Gotri_019159 [Gossypium trilobum]|uniref:DUF4283 domain-containing protein n=1 Tax=Gossypium trilobum TaxID=34281 RepID=A0A7J9EC03_9ROSI|nr:hypothetical protein [Gossypium trilobum]
MLKTVVIKLLERKIGYNALWNKACSLWKPSMRLQLMDIENDYFLANVVAWVRILGLSGSLYKKSILQAIGEMVGNVIKIDLMTNKGAKGQFARFAVQIDLRKPLVSKIRIASRIHRIMEDMEKGSSEAKDPIRLDQHENTTSIQERVDNERFGEWMIVDCRNRRQDEGTMMEKRVETETIFLDLDLIFFSKQVSHRMKATRIVKGQEKLMESVTKIMNERKFDGSNKGKNIKAKGHKKWARIREVVLKKSGMSSGTLKIGPKMGSRLPKFGTNRNQGTLDRKCHIVHIFKENQNPNNLIGSSPLMGNELGIKNVIPHSAFPHFLKENRSNNTLNSESRGDRETFDGLAGMADSGQILSRPSRVVYRGESDATLMNDSLDE